MLPEFRRTLYSYYFPSRHPFGDSLSGLRGLHRRQRFSFNPSLLQVWHFTRWLFRQSSFKCLDSQQNQNRASITWMAEPDSDKNRHYHCVLSLSDSSYRLLLYSSYSKGICPFRFLYSMSYPFKLNAQCSTQFILWVMRCISSRKQNHILR